MRILGLTTIALAAGLAFATPGHAQAPAATESNATATAAATENTAAPAPATAAPAAAEAAAPAAAKPADPTLNADGTHKTGPVAGIGQPVDAGYTLPHQVSPNGREALWFHNAVLMPVIVVISIFVLFLLLWVMARYRAKANPVPSKTSHNTLIEIVWTLLPVLILIAIAVPSIRLLSNQFKPAPDNAVTLKAIGNQWYWSYEYPDHGVSFDANLLKEQGEKLDPGQRYRTDVDGPKLLAADNRVVLPVGVPIRLITTANDVIHSWALPAVWIKLDAVPGRLNETSFVIDTPGVYYGQCSELCGARHGYMPITVEAVAPEVFAQWVASKGGKMPAAGPSAAAPAQPGSDKSDDTTTPANGTGPVENVTVTPPTTNQAATGNH